MSNSNSRLKDPLKVGIKSVNLPFQLYISIHNPAPKSQWRIACHSHVVPHRCWLSLSRFIVFRLVPYLSYQRDWVLLLRSGFYKLQQDKMNAISLFFYTESNTLVIIMDAVPKKGRSYAEST